jgi:hypothetical protein
MRFPLTIITLFCFYSAGSAFGPMTVVELFTRQGCYSCPPADALSEGSKKSRYDCLSLSCHVTYWNYTRLEKHIFTLIL